MVLLVVGTGGASRSGLGDGDAELVYAGEDGERFRGMLSKVENLVPAAAHEGRGDLEQPGAESFGLPLPRVVAGQRDGLHPGDHLVGELDDLAPDLVLRERSQRELQQAHEVLRERSQRELQQAHVFGVADPVLTPGPAAVAQLQDRQLAVWGVGRARGDAHADRKSTRLNSSHVAISYAVFCLKKKYN